MTVGYFYGIVRANLDTTYVHFLYDFGAVGYFIALLLNRKSPIQRYKLRRIMPWMVGLTAWPVLLLLAPTQTFMVQLVGLRGHIFFLPFLAVGAMVDDREVRKIALGLAILNCVALVFALFEVQFGVPLFYPFNAVDQLIYRSTDVVIGGVGTFRIPAIFENSAAYGGNMAGSIPLLIGGMLQEPRRGWWRRLLYVALAASAIGVFLGASRSQAASLLIIVLAITVSGRVRNFPRFGWIAMIGFVALAIISSTRMQRFLTLDNSRFLKARVSGSINESLIKLAVEYPMGNGLGGGGTSMPYFLESQVRHPVKIENEYGRIMLEQGLPGLALWIWFILWTLTRPLPRRTENWYLGRWLARVVLGVAFAFATTGTGLLTSIPGTALVLFYAGWVG
ncbi:MAG: O-antigen ligase family protein, partial [Gammaproteobacteria bacterium]